MNAIVNRSPNHDRARETALIAWECTFPIRGCVTDVQLRIESALRAARNETLEEAAKVATEFRVSDSRAPHKNIRDGIASAIRALKEKEND